MQSREEHNRGPLHEIWKKQGSKRGIEQEKMRGCGRGQGESGTELDDEMIQDRRRVPHASNIQSLQGDAGAILDRRLLTLKRKQGRKRDRQAKAKEL